MGCLGFPSFAAVFVYFTCFMCGISQLMPVNAIFSAPSYILFFYKYADKDPNAYPQFPNPKTDTKYGNFWVNVLTYYNFIGLIVCLIIEPLTISAVFGRINPMYRMLAGLIILVIEIALFLIVPAAGSKEAGCVATIVIGSVISGTGKAILESSVYGVFGGFPQRYPAAVMAGAGVSGALTSILQVIVRASIPDDGPRQAKVFYGLSVGIQGTTFLSVLSLRWNGYAQRYAACFRPAGAPAPGDVRPEEIGAYEGEGGEAASGSSECRRHPVAGTVQLHDDDEPAAAGAEPKRDPLAPEEDVPTAVRREPTEEFEIEEEGEAGAGAELTVSETPKFPVFRALWTMFTACAFCFLVSLMLFPSVVVNMDPNDYWYPTLIVLVFNVMDVAGRFSPSFAFMLPAQRRRVVVLIASLLRVVFIPLLMVASYRYVTHQAYAYVLIVIFGYSNGYIGSAAMVLGPRSPGVKTAAQRFIAGTMMGIGILLGGAIGSAFSIIIETVRTNNNS